MTLLARDGMTIGVSIGRDTETCAEAAVRIKQAQVIAALEATGRACGWATRND